MTIQYPQAYSVRSQSPSGIQSRWTTLALSPASELPSLACAIPPEFAGPGGGASPEDFYALALLNCFVATFKVFAEKSRIAFDAIETEGKLIVDRDEKGVPWMAKFHLQAKVSGAEDSERVRTLLEKTSRSCLILNSVKTEKSFEFEVTK